MDWLNVLDLPRSLDNRHRDLIGDWYRDPWSWPELDWTVEKRPELVVERCAATDVRRFSKIDVPKENFAMRPAVVLDPIEHLAYQALVDAVSVTLIGNLRPWVFGWRLPRSDAQRGRYSASNEEWARYRKHVQWFAEISDAGLQTDVVSYFASIPVTRLADTLVAKAYNDVTKRLRSLLEG